MTCTSEMSLAGLHGGYARLKVWYKPHRESETEHKRVRRPTQLNSAVGAWIGTSEVSERFKPPRRITADRLADIEETEVQLLPWGPIFASVG